MKFAVSLIFLLSIATVCEADTLYVEAGNVNGHVTYNDGKFTLTAEFNGTKKQFKIDRKNVVKVEINTNVDNNGGPPDWLTALGGKSSKSDSAGSSNDELFFRQDNKIIGEIGELDVISDNEISMKGRSPHSKRVVIRIELN